MRFIYTNDLDIKNTLSLLGYKLLKCNNDKMWVFQNNYEVALSSPIDCQFTKTDKGKLVFSDILTF